MFDGNVGREGPEIGVGDEAGGDILVGDGLEEGESDGGEACAFEFGVEYVEFIMSRLAKQEKCNGTSPICSQKHELTHRH